MGTAAAFFDLDRTLMSGSSGFYWARAAAGAGLMSRRQLASDALANIKFRLRGSTDESAERLRERLAVALQDKRVRDFERLGPTVLAGILPRLYPQVLRVAWEHQDAGRAVYVATAASQGTADMIAHVLGFDGALGSLLEQRDGLYTGRFLGPMAYREGKAARIRELASTGGIDLAASYAYSDSESDLPMLRAVGHPVAVNPDAPLAQIAAQEGWEVMRFERLGGHLKMAAALGAAVVLGGAGRSLAAAAGDRPTMSRPPATTRRRRVRRSRP